MSSYLTLFEADEAVESSSSQELGAYIFETLWYFKQRCSICFDGLYDSHFYKRQLSHASGIAETVTTRLIVAGHVQEASEVVIPFIDHNRLISPELRH